MIVDDKRERWLIISIIGVSILAIVFSLLSAVLFFFWMMIFSLFVVLGMGACVDIMVRFGRWKWATKTERYKERTSSTSIKPTILATWAVGSMVCALSVFIWTILYS